MGLGEHHIQMKSEEWQTYILCEYPAPAPLSQWVALPQNEPCSEARAQPDTFDPSVGLQINPCCPSAELNMHQLPTEPGAPRGWWLCARSQGGENPAGPGLLASAEHEYQARRAGFPTGGCADGFTLFGPSQHDLYWNFVV